MGNVTISKYDSIRLDGVVRQGEGLRLYCSQQLDKTTTAQWMFSIYHFIIEWLSPHNYITAHTSGSTGVPKEIRLLKKHMIASAQKTNHYFNLSAHKTALLCLSANYIAGKMMLVRAMVGGFNLKLAEPTGTPLKYLSQSIDFAAMVPLQVFNSLTDFTDQVKTVIIGGGAVSAELTESLRSLPTCFYETYGMTETVSHVAVKLVGAENATFKAMPQVSFALDCRGCLQITAPDITDQVIVTNDMVALIDETEFSFLGRFDHVINSGGIKIIPEEVERKLSTFIKLPFLISSQPDAKLGDKLVLVVESKTNLAFSTSDLSPYLSPYQIPKIIVLLEQFPLTDSGKIKRNEVKSMILGVVK